MNNFVKWNYYKLSEIATFRRGSFPQPYGLDKWYDDENGFPFVQVFDVGDNMRLKDKTKRKISSLAGEQSVFVQKGTIILTIQGSIGRIAITHYEAYIDRTLLIFQNFKLATDKKFFMYAVHRLFEDEKKRAQGSTIATITKEQLSSFVIPLPSLLEQQKIAEILSLVDQKIDIVVQQITENQKLKKGLVLCLLSKGIGHKEFKNSPLGLIPNSWTYGTISKLFPEKNAIKTGPFGSSITKSMYVKNGFKIYGQEQVISNNPNVGNYFINQEKFNELKRYKIQTGDLLISLVGTLGKILIIEENALPGIINPRLLKITPNPNEYCSKFLKQLLISDTIQNQMKKMSVGGTMSILNGTIVKSIKIVKPPLEEQKRIADILTTVDKKIEVLLEKKINYQKLKQGLMQQLLTGKIRVKV